MLTQEEKDNLNSPISINKFNKINLQLKIFEQRKLKTQMASQANSITHLWKKIASILDKFLENKKGGNILFNI